MRATRSFTIARRAAFAAGLVGAIGASNCSFDDPVGQALTVRVGGSQKMFVAFEVGDEPTFVATETDHDTGKLKDSQGVPADFGWLSSDTSVAAISASGSVRMKRIGASVITVRSPRTSFTFRVYVGPRFGRIVLVPDSSTIGVGETATLEILAYDPDDKPISPDSSRGYTALSLLSTGVVTLSPPVGYYQWTALGAAPGKVRVVAIIDAWKGERLRDTSVIVVR